MPAREAVVEASVLGAAAFPETHSTAAEDFLKSAPSLIAPTLLVVEMTSLAAKKVWRSETDAETARLALHQVQALVDRLMECTSLYEDALALACEGRVSAYDAFYLALARRERIPLVTLDRRMIVKAQQVAPEVMLIDPSA